MQVQLDSSFSAFLVLMLLHQEVEICYLELYNGHIYQRFGLLIYKMTHNCITLHVFLKQSTNKIDQQGSFAILI